MILRDLVSRITFKTDTTELTKLNTTMGGVKRIIAAAAGAALSFSAIKMGANFELLEGQLKSLQGGSVTPLIEKI